jgi:hypothetical protein
VAWVTGNVLLIAQILIPTSHWGDARVIEGLTLTPAADSGAESQPEEGGLKLRIPVEEPFPMGRIRCAC